MEKPGCAVRKRVQRAPTHHVKGRRLRSLPLVKGKRGVPLRGSILTGIWGAGTFRLTKGSSGNFSHHRKESTWAQDGKRMKSETRGIPECVSCKKGYGKVRPLKRGKPREAKERFHSKWGNAQLQRNSGERHPKLLFKSAVME